MTCDDLKEIAPKPAKQATMSELAAVLHHARGCYACKLWLVAFDAAYPCMMDTAYLQEVSVKLEAALATDPELSHWKE